MNENDVQVSRINRSFSSENLDHEYFAIPLLNSDALTITIDGEQQSSDFNTLYFLHPRKNWRIEACSEEPNTGYLLLIKRSIMENPLLSKLHITEVRLFAQDQVPKINLAPGIEKRVFEILEMLDELIGSHLKHKEDAIISLINTLFVYCDGQCNIKSVFLERNSKKSIVFQFKKLLNRKINTYFEVDEYAKQLNISPKYLNECVKEVLGTNVKRLITEQRIMKARHELKFGDKSIKEISFELGFSSPDYFSSFYKRNTGQTPSMVRNG
jgi:AraC-like DNA-binding protein